MRDFILFKIRGIDKSNLLIGHKATNDILREAKKRLKQKAGSIRFYPMLGGNSRLAGTLNDACTEAKQVQDLILEAERPYQSGGQIIQLSPITAVIIPGELCLRKSRWEKFRLAEIALHKVSRNTQLKPPVIVLNRKMINAFYQEECLFHDLRKAIDNHEFFLVYQPLVQICSTVGEYRTVGFESLVRWKHPKHGIVYPGAFIPVAETFNIIQPISLQILEMGFAQLKQWESFGVYLSINFSASDMQNDTLLNHLIQGLDSWGLDPTKVLVEITETASLDIGDVGIRQVAERIKATGVRIALDDFGTGYNTLEMLHLPVDVIKIDRQYVSGKPIDLPVCDFISALAHCRGKIVVAEGVETLAQTQAMRDYRVDICQGYYFSKPLLVSDATVWLIKER